MPSCANMFVLEYFPVESTTSKYRLIPELDLFTALIFKILLKNIKKHFKFHL